MGRHIAFLMLLLFTQGCAKKDGEARNELDFAELPSPTGTGASPTTDTATEKATKGANAPAVMTVARALAARRGADPVEIGRFCDDNAAALGSQADVHACKAVARSTAALVPVPASIEQMLTTAATLSVKDRFTFCTSAAALKLQRAVEDYDRCFPPSVRAEFEAMGGIDSIDYQDTNVTPEELSEQVLRDAARMSEAERKMYCNVASVRSALGVDSRGCLAGTASNERGPGQLTDDDAGYRDEDH